MFGNFFYRLKRRKYPRESGEISPDEILLDSANLPQFDVVQMEGRMEKAISLKAFLVASIIFAGVFVAILVQVWRLQVDQGEAYGLLSERNALRHEVFFASRGIIYDRNGDLLVYNSVSSEHPDYPSRKYSDKSGLAHLLGYVKYPAKDQRGVFYTEDYVGKEGVESFYNSFLTGVNGLRIMETNALGHIESESVIKLPIYGGTLTLSVDSELQHELYSYMEGLSKDVGFVGGAGVIMDVVTGEIIALTSFPEFSSEVLSDGSDSKTISYYVNNKATPFLNRVTNGLYIPGSIIKPFFALGALEEGLISPTKQIYSAGFISIPNPYDQSKPTIFKDWKAHGYTDMVEALSVSSDVYFYALGGGYEDQKGLGIGRLNDYARLFGFGATFSGSFLSGPGGIVPNPEWKAETFDGEAWRIGDTYNTSIGQYGFQVTPIQVVRAVSALANGGKLLEPTVVLGERRPPSLLDIEEGNLDVVRRGMRQAVKTGTASGLNLPFVEIAAKTGTAELGSKKEFVNSWITGFFPYEKPRYAFAVVMERGPRANTIGALYVMRQLFEWMNENRQEYFR